MSTDEYGRAPDYVNGTVPGSAKLRTAMFGKTVVPRPEPAPPLPAFVNDQPES